MTSRQHFLPSSIHPLIWHPSSTSRAGSGWGNYTGALKRRHPRVLCMCQWKRTCQEEIISAEQKLRNYPLPLSLLHLMEPSPTLHPAVDGRKPLHDLPLLVQSSAALFAGTFESGRLLRCDGTLDGNNKHFLFLHPMATSLSTAIQLIGGFSRLFSFLRLFSSGKLRKPIWKL